MQTQAQFETVWQAAIRYLAVKSYSVGEISQKLRDKRLPQPLIMQVIRKLEELDFVNDRRYAQIYVENLKRYRYEGYYGIKKKLIGKKIPSDILEETLDSFYTPEEEAQVAARYAAKLKRQGRTTLEQLARALTSKGFRAACIRQAIKRADSFE